MGDIKEIFDVWVARIRAPIFGYFSLSFLAANWKEIYYLLFSEVDALSRIEYFETNTCLVSLFWMPLGFAVAAALGYPWVQWGLMRATSYPNGGRNACNAKVESDLLAVKINLENKRNELARQKELEVVEKAKIDESIEGIEDGKAREKARDEVKSIRSKETILREPITRESLKRYLGIRFPNLPGDDRITTLFLNDLNPKKYKHIEDIDLVLEKSKGFIEYYENISPTVFKSGIDFVTKSFGFYDSEFRKKHAFSENTKQAIDDYINRV
ncbi:hypothetical protein KO507_04205 [Gilvimarinus agarilyticus]|uniref:hypothetical protein n=1 Tax=Gilvimarinus sp. 2_MG-2023 TaxID=3062666 RepID=UPI001C082C59|nr:hypothetical protein [Gilvimarinus sp. 2_MG-2023]MBU2884967.1 hypothetical protein [Gilvimarinus agarilyticus]MDO6569864.1 hypothetical protein [Gilvimarinus sp. 2_MG-2023]